MAGSRKIAGFSIARWMIGFAVAMAIFAAPLRAQAQAEPTASQTATVGAWQFNAASFVWLPSVAGNVSVKGQDITTDASIWDILSKSKFPIALMGNLEARNSDWGFYVEPMYMELRFSPTRSNLSADVTSKLFFLEFGGYYRVLQGDSGPAGSGQRWALDVLAGGRYTSLSNATSLTFRGPVDTVTRSSSVGIDWVDPIVGARLAVDLSPSWTTLLRADIGGFNAGSDFSWQAYALAGYKFDMWGKPAVAFGGFRALSQDYKSGGPAGFRWNNTLYGPVIGLMVTF